MNNTTKVTIVAIAAALLCSFASNTTYGQDTKQLTPPRQGYGRIWFYRQSRFIGGGIQPPVLLNGEKIGKAKPGGSFYVDRPAGTYVVTCENEQINECRIVVTPHSTRYVRLSTSQGEWIAQIVPQEMSATTALKELAQTHSRQ
jgi:hypothetical protein